VQVSVSTGQSTTAVPDVRGLDEGSAQATLDNEGWEVVIRDTPTQNPDEDGVVISQTPPPGEQAEPGARVTLFVGRLQTPEPPPEPPIEPPPPPPAPAP
jgi:serine/threonine-protein kinase